MSTLYIVIAVAVVLLIALVVVYLLQQKKKKKAAAAAAEGGEPVGPGGDEIATLVKEAEARLAAAKLEQGARVANLPVYLLMGESGSTKTSIMTNSGLEAELLAGQVYQNNAVVPTRAANFWFARRSVFVEAGGNLPGDSGKWHRLIRKLAPRGSVVGKGEQAGRAAIVCYDCENFTRQGALEAAVAAARNLRARLGEISQTLGINLPVYVLFTKMDRLPFFTEFVRNLSNEEAVQVVGATLPMTRSRGEGVYADEESARLGGHFEWLFRSLANARPEFLSRETDASKLPACYEFPREFRKLRQTAVQFLVDLCRPSQLSTGPFLRGFYFTGVRPVIINEAAPSSCVGAAGAGTGRLRLGLRRHRYLQRGRARRGAVAVCRSGPGCGLAESAPVGLPEPLLQQRIAGRPCGHGRQRIQHQNQLRAASAADCGRGAVLHPHHRFHRFVLQEPRPGSAGARCGPRNFIHRIGGRRPGLGGFAAQTRHPAAGSRAAGRVSPRWRALELSLAALRGQRPLSRSPARLFRALQTASLRPDAGRNAGLPAKPSGDARDPTTRPPTTR